MRGARNSSRGTEAIASSTRSSVTPCGRSCSATLLCAGVLTGTFLPREYNQQRLIGVVRPVPDPAEMAPPGQATFTPGQTNGPRSLSRRVRASIRAGIRPLPRLLPDPMAVRAGVVPDRVGGSPRGGDVHTRLLPARARPLHRADNDEAVARHAEEPEAAHAARAVPRAQRPAALPQGLPPAPRQGGLWRAGGPAPAQGRCGRDPDLPGGAGNPTARPRPQDLPRLPGPVAGPGRGAQGHHIFPRRP